MKLCTEESLMAFVLLSSFLPIFVLFLKIDDERALNHSPRNVKNI